MLHHVCKESVFSLILKLSKQDHTSTFRERAIERRVFQVWDTEDQEGGQKKKLTRNNPSTFLKGARAPLSCSLLVFSLQTSRLYCEWHLLHFLKTCFRSNRQQTESDLSCSVLCFSFKLVGFPSDPPPLVSLNTCLRYWPRSAHWCFPPGLSPPLWQHLPPPCSLGPQNGH